MFSILLQQRWTWLILLHREETMLGSHFTLSNEFPFDCEAEFPYILYGSLGSLSHDSTEGNQGSLSTSHVAQWFFLITQEELALFLKIFIFTMKICFFLYNVLTFSSKKCLIPIILRFHCLFWLCSAFRLGESFTLLINCFIRFRK